MLIIFCDVIDVEFLQNSLFYFLFLICFYLQRNSIFLIICVKRGDLKLLESSYEILIASIVDDKKYIKVPI